MKKESQKTTHLMRRKEEEKFREVKLHNWGCVFSLLIFYLRSGLFPRLVGTSYIGSYN